MQIDLAEYASETLDFLCTDTLYEIDCGILDLSDVEDVELRQVYRFLEELLTVELLLNYRKSATGIFRVYRFGQIWCYCDGRHVITALTCSELEENVLCEGGIWYVFDYDLAERQRRFE